MIMYSDDIDLDEAARVLREDQPGKLMRLDMRYLGVLGVESVERDDSGKVVAIVCRRLTGRRNVTIRFYRSRLLGGMWDFQRTWHFGRFRFMF